MKKAITLSFTILGVVFLTSMVFNHSAAQTSTKAGIVSKPISPKVMKIADRSCVKCHTEPGNGMALAHLNLSNWDKFSMEKQADKAKDMCKMVSKDKMPPKSFREKNPGGAPTQQEVKTICDWAQSIQIIKK
jgi:Haem-binding domain